MSYKLMFIFTAIVAFAFGVGHLIMPEPVLTFFGVTENYVATQVEARFFGSALFSLALVLWFAKDIADAAIQRNFGYALLIGNIVGLVLAIWGSTNVIRANSWIPILIYVLLGLGYTFILFLKPRMKE